MTHQQSRGPSSGPEWRRSRNEGPEEGPRRAPYPALRPEHLEQEHEPHEPDEDALGDPLPRLRPRRRGKRLVRADGRLKPSSLTAEQRVLILDSWLRSGLPAKDFAPLVGVSHHTLYNWRRKFHELGPAGMEEGRRGRPRGS